MPTITARKQAEISEKMKLLPALMNQAAEQEKFKTRVEHTLFGNGEPGMDERLRTIERSIKTLVQLAWLMTGTVGGYVSLELFKVVFAR